MSTCGSAPTMWEASHSAENPLVSTWRSASRTSTASCPAITCPRWILTMSSPCQVDSCAGPRHMDASHRVVGDLGDVAGEMLVLRSVWIRAAKRPCRVVGAREPTQWPQRDHVFSILRITAIQLHDEDHVCAWGAHNQPASLEDDLTCVERNSRRPETSSPIVQPVRREVVTRADIR